MEKRNSQLEHGQPMELTRGLCLVCTCHLGVAHCQSQHKYHFWGIKAMFEAYCTGKRAWQLSIKFCVIHEAMNSCKNLKTH